jgi:hypothetical protein
MALSKGDGGKPRDGFRAAQVWGVAGGLLPAAILAPPLCFSFFALAGEFCVVSLDLQMMLPGVFGDHLGFPVLSKGLLGLLCFVHEISP